MASEKSHKTVHIIFTFVILISTSVSSVLSEDAFDSGGNRLLRNQTFLVISQRQQKFRRIRTYLRRINKPPIKTIESPDGDLIDCVPSHLQPAFDHPQHKGQKPLVTEKPTSRSSAEIARKSFQLWSDHGESCPEGTVPIRRTTFKEVLRAGRLRKFGRKSYGKQDSKTNGDDQVKPLGTFTEDCFFGARVMIHVWKANKTDDYDFRLSQLWMASGNSTSGNLNTVEAGWRVNPKLFGDNSPRFFTYWTTDSYGTTGCYNLLCSGFVQTNNRIALGAAISPRFSQNGRELEVGIPMMIAKDVVHGHWWLEIGPGFLIGYWPSFLFTRLQSHADLVQFGGIMVKTKAMGLHATAQKGTGDISNSGDQDPKAAEGVDKLVPLCNVEIFSKRPLMMCTEDEMMEEERDETIEEERLNVESSSA